MASIRRRIRLSCRKATSTVDTISETDEVDLDALMALAVMKACFDMRRFLLRGLEGVQAEWQWCCTAFNLKKLMTLIAALRAEQDKAAKIEG